jgi:HEPN domain-containing protein
MPKSGGGLPEAWFAQADLDLEAADILMSLVNGPLRVIAFHLQQAIEKYLKGYPIATG